MFEVAELRKMPLAQLDALASWCIEESQGYASVPITSRVIDGMEFYDRKADLYLGILLERIAAGETLPGAMA